MQSEHAAVLRITQVPQSITRSFPTGSSSVPAVGSSSVLSVLPRSVWTVLMVMSAPDVMRLAMQRVLGRHPSAAKHAGVTTFCGGSIRGARFGDSAAQRRQQGIRGLWIDSERPDVV